MTDTLTGPVQAPPLDSVKDFSRPRKRIRFRIDGDLFEAASALPAETLVEFANGFGEVNAKVLPPSELFTAVRDVLGLVLLPESFKRLSARLRDRQHPVDMDQMTEAVVWLVEQYGLRPTQPPSSSPGGPDSPASGTSSTASTPDAGSTSAVSPSTAS